jgi:hypothetical protein
MATTTKGGGSVPSLSWNPLNDRGDLHVPGRHAPSVPSSSAKSLNPGERALRRQFLPLVPSSSGKSLNVALPPNCGIAVNRTGFIGGNHLQSPHHRGRRSTVPGGVEGQHQAPSVPSSSGKSAQRRSEVPNPRMDLGLQSPHHRGSRSTWWSRSRSRSSSSLMIGEVTQRPLRHSRGAVASLQSPHHRGRRLGSNGFLRVVPSPSRTHSCFSPLIIGEVAQRGRAGQGPRRGSSVPS